MVQWFCRVSFCGSYKHVHKRLIFRFTITKEIPLALVGITILSIIFYAARIQYIPTKQAYTESNIYVYIYIYIYIRTFINQHIVIRDQYTKNSKTLLSFREIISFICSNFIFSKFASIHPIFILSRRLFIYCLSC